MLQIYKKQHNHPLMIKPHLLIAKIHGLLIEIRIINVRQEANLKITTM